MPVLAWQGVLSCQLGAGHGRAVALEYLRIHLEAGRVAGPGGVGGEVAIGEIVGYYLGAGEAGQQQEKE